MMSGTPSKNRKVSRYISGGVILICVIIYMTFIRPQQQYYKAHHVDISGVYLINPIPIEEFRITDHHGHPFSKENLKNRWSLVFFGFTHCGMICPVTLGAFNQMYQSLQNTLPKQSLPQIVFITVDPERDTQERLSEYINSFNQQFIGARTSKDKTALLEKTFHITKAQKQFDKSNKQQYAMNHDTKILLINPSAQIQALFSYPPKPKNMARDFNAILSKYNRRSQKRP